MTRPSQSKRIRSCSSVVVLVGCLSMLMSVGVGAAPAPSRTLPGSRLVLSPQVHGRVLNLAGQPLANLDVVATKKSSQEHGARHERTRAANTRLSVYYPSGIMRSASPRWGGLQPWKQLSPRRRTRRGL